MRDHAQTSDRKSLMRWCVSEAVLDHYRNFLLDAKTMVLMRDERHGRVLLRFSAASDDMRTLRGVLGQLKGQSGSNAEAILQATSQIITEFCTPLANASRNTRFAIAKTDEALLQHIRNIIEIVVTDAAPNEILASNMGRGTRGEPAAEAFTPNVKFLIRDHAHAVKRTPHNLCFRKIIN
ncbi:MAG: hypothetical protein GY772_09645 [bacterium]|nr:hypothetical protein [bacterium]